MPFRLTVFAALVATFCFTMAAPVFAERSTSLEAKSSSQAMKEEGSSTKAKKKKQERRAKKNPGKKKGNMHQKGHEKTVH